MQHMLSKARASGHSNPHFNLKPAEDQQCMMKSGIRGNADVSLRLYNRRRSCCRARSSGNLDGRHSMKPGEQGWCHIPLRAVDT